MLNELSSAKNALSVLVLALVIALYLFANSTFFEIENIEWTGLSYLNAEQLNVYAALPVTNVWRIDTKEFVALLQQHPWIETAKATWRWPNRLIVFVEERWPIAQTPSLGGWVLLDKEGNLLPAMEGVVVYTLPIITSLDLDSSEQLVAAARSIGSIPSKLMSSISEWNATNRSFVTISGVEILMGPPVDLEEKFALLENILADLQLRGERPKRIDLRVPKSPVVSVL